MLLYPLFHPPTPASGGESDTVFIHDLTNVYGKKYSKQNQNHGAIYIFPDFIGGLMKIRDFHEFYLFPFLFRRKPVGRAGMPAKLDGAPSVPTILERR